MPCWGKDDVWPVGPKLSICGEIKRRTVFPVTFAIPPPPVDGDAFASSLQCKQLGLSGRSDVCTIAWCRPFRIAAVRESRFLIEAGVQGQVVT